MALGVERWWSFRSVRLGVEGFGCSYKHRGSKFVAAENLRLGNNVHIGPGAMIDATGEIEIGDGTVFAPEVWVYSRTHRFDAPAEALPFDNVVLCKKIVIGRYVWVGARATILPGVAIGDGAVIGAGAVVSSDIPRCGVAVGNPARVVKYRDPEHFAKLLNSEKPFVYAKFGHAKQQRVFAK